MKFLITQYRSLLVAIIATLLISGWTNSAMSSSQPAGSWADLQQRGTSALDANQYWIAEPLLKKALAQAEKANPKDIRLAKSLGELGRLYTIRGRFEEAEAYLEEELSIRELIAANDRTQCIPNMGSLIQFYLNYRTQDKAIPLTDEMLALVEGRLEEARAGSHKVRFQKGQPLQGWLGVTAAQARQPVIDWAITCDAVGNSYKAAGNYDEASKLFKAAMEVKTTVLGNDHLSLANSYDSLGSVYQEKGDLREAEYYFIDALKITEKTLEPECHETFIRMDKLARLYIKEGKYKPAEDLYLRASHFWKAEQSKYGDEARVAFALGSLYAQEHRYEAALPYLERALELAKKFNGPDSIAVVPYLKKYGYVLYYVGRKGEMEQLQARATNIAGPGE